MMSTYSDGKGYSKQSGKLVQRQAAIRTRVVEQPGPEEIIRRIRMDPSSLTHEDVMLLQRTIGNRAVIRLLSGINSGQSLHAHGEQDTAAYGENVKTKDGHKKRSLSIEKNIGIRKRIAALGEAAQNRYRI